MTSSSLQDASHLSRLVFDLPVREAQHGEAGGDVGLVAQLVPGLS
jgi:hypothetical protein